MQSDSIDKLAAALAKAQGAMHAVAKDATNPFFNSKYATLAATWDAIRGPLTDNGLAVVQTTALVETGGVLETTLVHSSGQWIRGQYPLNPSKSDPQGLGSCVTYARRYALQAIAGVCPDDDDGNIANNRDPEARATAKKPAAAKSAAKKAETQHDLTAVELSQMRTMYKVLTTAPYDVERDFLIERCLPENYAAFSDVDKAVYPGVMTAMATMKRTMDKAFKEAE